MPDFKRSITVVGGLAGMVAALRLLELGCDVALYDSDSRLGGKAGANANGAGRADDDANPQRLALCSTARILSLVAKSVDFNFRHALRAVRDEHSIARAILRQERPASRNWRPAFGSGDVRSRICSGPRSASLKILGACTRRTRLN